MKFFWSNLSVASLHPVNNTFMKVYRLKEEALRLQYCCRYLSLLPSFYETQSIHVECKQNVFLLLILCYSFKFRKKKKKLTPALFVNDFCSPKVTTPLKLQPPKAANSESNEGRYYRNSTNTEEKSDNTSLPG